MSLAKNLLNIEAEESCCRDYAGKDCQQDEHNGAERINCWVKGTDAKEH